MLTYVYTVLGIYVMKSKKEKKLNIKDLYNNFSVDEKTKIYNMYLNYNLRVSYSGFLPKRFKDWILSYSEFPYILKSIAKANI